MDSSSSSSSSLSITLKLSHATVEHIYVNKNRVSLLKTLKLFIRVSVGSKQNDRPTTADTGSLARPGLQGAAEKSSP